MEFETTVKEIIRRTHDVKSFRLEAPRDFSYKAGQFLFVTIRINKRETQKHFSFSSSPTEKGYVEFTKRLTGHEFSNGLDKLEVGDWARLKAPYGDFTFEGQYSKAGILTGGIGITAIRSICRFCTDNSPNTDIVLLYGNRTEVDIVFRDDLEKMETTNRRLRVVHTLSEPSSEWSGHSGRISKEMVEQEIPDHMERVFFSCGPPALVEAMQKILTELGLPKKQVITERFPGY
ncbi:MAG: FAD-binding oxidoreductase [archaeon]